MEMLVDLGRTPPAAVISGSCSGLTVVAGPVRGWPCELAGESRSPTNIDTGDVEETAGAPEDDVIRAVELIGVDAATGWRIVSVVIPSAGVAP